MEDGSPALLDVSAALLGASALVWLVAGAVFWRRLRDALRPRDAWGRLKRAAAWIVARRERLAERAAWLIAVGLFLLALYLVIRSTAVGLGSEAAWLGLDDAQDKWAEIRNGLLIGAAALGAPFVIWRTLLATRQTAI